MQGIKKGCDDRMLVSYQWLKEYVEVKGTPAEELAERITRSGIEVDTVENRNKGVENVVVGYVVSREKHPNADKLSVCQVDAGQEERLQIVCGAKNVAAGQKVPVALVGAKLPDGVHIKRAKLRGVESQGMICSAKELGLNDRLLPKELQEGILVLPEDTPVGASILEVLGIDDKVMEFDLTPNRSDCLSMLGAAYEVAAILGSEVKLPEPGAGLENGTVRAADRIRVSVEEPELCPHYAARYLEEVRIGPSPLWMQNRLMAAGIRPINNVVDITNYVMLEYGQPLHAFDADRLNEGQIVVRRAREGERMVTLDDVERILEPHMLLITDGTKPVAIAGVMGGANSEVTPATTRILLESARFDGGSVRRTSRQLGLRSEASLRFEKEVNPAAVLPALDRAADLMRRYAGAQVARGVVQAAAKPAEPVSVRLSVDRVNGYLGTSLSAGQVREVLQRLRFDFAGSGGVFDVAVPSRRGDITREVDLIEEVARLHGYDNIPTSLMSGVTTPGSLTREQRIRRNVRSLLAESGLNEVVTYSFTHPGLIASFPGLYREAKPVALSMPMSEERSVLRTSLIPHLIETAVYNRNRSINDVAIFEIGKVFVTEEAVLSRLPEEKWMLSLLWTGRRSPLHFAAKAEPVDFYDLKGVFEKLTNALGIAHVQYRAASPEGFHPGRTAEIVCAPDGRSLARLGWIGQLHPAVQQEKDLGDTYVLEVELDTLIRYADDRIAYRTLPRYPSVGRDLAVVVSRETAAGDLADAIRAAAGPLLASLQVFDIYTGERLGRDRKSVAFSLVYLDPERTLTDEEVGEVHQRVIAALEQNFAAELRK